MTQKILKRYCLLIPSLFKRTNRKNFDKDDRVWEAQNHLENSLKTQVHRFASYSLIFMIWGSGARLPLWLLGWCVRMQSFEKQQFHSLFSYTILSSAFQLCHGLLLSTVQVNMLHL